MPQGRGASHKGRAKGSGQRRVLASKRHRRGRQFRRWGLKGVLGSETSGEGIVPRGRFVNKATKEKVRGTNRS